MNLLECSTIHSYTRNVTALLGNALVIVAMYPRKKNLRQHALEAVKGGAHDARTTAAEFDAPQPLFLKPLACYCRNGALSCGCRVGQRLHARLEHVHRVQHRPRQRPGAPAGSLSGQHKPTQEPSASATRAHGSSSSRTAHATHHEFPRRQHRKLMHGHARARRLVFLEPRLHRIVRPKVNRKGRL